jgi:hypothetical protein
MPSLKFLGADSDQTRAQVAQMIEQGKLASHLRQRYPVAHGIRTDRALYDYVQDLKTEFLRNAEPISKVAFDNKIQVISTRRHAHRHSRVRATSSRPTRDPHRHRVQGRR